MIEKQSLRSGSYGKKGGMNLRDIKNSNLRYLINPLEWDKSRVTCKGIKETPAHVPRQLKDGPRPEQTLVIWVKLAQDHEGSNQVR